MALSQEQSDYLQRSIDRVRLHRLEAARRELEQIKARNSAAGRLQSGATLMQAKEAFLGQLAEAAAEMIRAAFNLIGDTSGQVSSLIEQSLTKLRRELEAAMAGLIRTIMSPPTAGEAIGFQLSTEGEAMISHAMDDFRHGMLRGEKLVANPAMSITNIMTNSPGAIQQGGTGNVALSAGQSKELLDALATLVGSSEVAALPSEEKDAVTDIADAMAKELNQPAPDMSRVGRWRTRLLAVCEKVGISAAAGVITKVLLG